MDHFFKDKDQWICAKQPLELHHDIGYFIEQIQELDYKESYKILTKKLKELNCSIPPLIAAYMNL
jgi:arginyl-tRNA--protein-N-Asp/Glu arginylyltransferase